MAVEHYAVLGLARVRSAWFRDVSRWATSGHLPVEFVKCISIEELRARLRSGRAFSAVLVDGGLPAIDRDLLDDCRSQGCAVVVVDDTATRRNWVELGAAAVLVEPVEREALATVLADHARALDDLAQPLDVRPDLAVERRARWIAVVGGGGTGTSVTAMTIAQGLAREHHPDERVVLADLALHADQAMLHDAGDVIPSVQELVDAHRTGRPSAEEVRSLTFGSASRGYDLLLGLRRHRDWPALRPRAVGAALDGLQHAYDVVVADTEPDVEGEPETGSLDVEERNTLARESVVRADVVVMTAVPTVTGLHRFVQLLDEMRRVGVEAERVLTVINRAPRSPRLRAELTRALARLTGEVEGVDQRMTSPLFVTERRQLDDCLRAADPLPGAMASLLASGVRAVLDRTGRPEAAGPERIRPGSLGSWAVSDP
jgi:MinD-like ATPase involved in chromosome partitioning or flagellar assembly